MARNLFAMSLSASSHTGTVTLLERAFDERGAHALGHVETSTYFGPAEPSFWRRLLRRRQASVLRPPFDERGRDVHGLLAARPPVFDGADDPPNAVRSVRGTIDALSPREPGDEIAMRDVWAVDQGARLCAGVHFGLTRVDGPPVAVAFAMSPLIVAPPSPMTLAAALEDGPLSERAFTNAWPALDLAREAIGVELRVGDVVEVIGLVSRPEDCAGRFDLEHRSASYREAAPLEALTLVIGDRPGLRMVIRRV